MANSLPYTKKTFDDAEDATKLSILFDIADASYKLLQSHMLVCNARFVKIENRKTRDTAISGAMGMFGGIVTMLGWILGKMKFGNGS